MNAVFQKIAAFFLSIIAFFAGLFGLNKKPADPEPEPTVTEQPATEPTTEEPTTEEEPTVTDYIDARYPVPVPGAGADAGVYESSGGTVICRREQTEEADFNAYIALLRGLGFTVYDENRIEDNRFATLYLGDTAVSVSYFSRTGTLRVIAEPKGEFCPLSDPYEETCETLLTGMKGETSVAAEGMGFIIRLADGSFCIIDGGMGDPDHVDSDKLMGILNAQKPADAEKPVIAAWIFTHLHGDHIGVFNCFSLDHHDDVVIERLYYNFPKEEETALSDSPYMLDDTIYRYTQFKRNLADFYADVPVVKPHSGNRFAVRNAEFEVLYAYDDLYPKTILNGGMNECSLLLKMTVGRQSVMWTGDFAFTATALVLQEYETALSADILQMAHHGWNGTPEFYAAVNPTYALLPVSFYVDPAEMFSSAANAWLRNSPKLRQVIATYCGTWTVRLPYTPAEGTYERIPSPGTVYPAYPDLLGE
jgi:glyoxylase-like metal-dependent hydrolase (beta-lactamase superfamily II)